MTKAETVFCNAVATEFKSRWEEEFDGEAFGCAEYLLSEGEITLNMSVNDAVRAIDILMSGPPIYGEISDKL